jgi:hypothetical protein
MERGPALRDRVALLAQVILLQRDGAFDIGHGKVDGSGIIALAAADVDAATAAARSQQRGRTGRNDAAGLGN